MVHFLIFWINSLKIFWLIFVSNNLRNIWITFFGCLLKFNYNKSPWKLTVATKENWSRIVPKFKRYDSRLTQKINFFCVLSDLETCYRQQVKHSYFNLFWKSFFFFFGPLFYFPYIFHPQIQPDNLLRCLNSYFLVLLVYLEILKTPLFTEHFA